MKKLILVTLVLCMALSESTASGGKSAASEVSLPEKTKTAAHMTKTLSSGVVVDADVTMPESMQKTELPEMKGTGHEVAHEGLSEVFFGGAEVESTVTEIADNGYFSSNTMLELWQVGDTVLSAVGTTVAYSNGREVTAMYLFSEYASSLPFGDNRAVYLTGKNLDFATKEKMRAYIDALGVSVLEPTCYTMDYDTMRAVYDGRTALETYNADFDFVIEPTKENEQYVLEYPITVNGMPLGSFDGGSYSGDVWATGTSVKVFYGAEGLNMLAMPYALDVTDAGTPQPVLTLDEAIQKLEEKFDSMIVEGEWRVDEIEMAYIAVPIEGTNDARLLPVWRFQTEHTMEYAGKDDPSQTTTLTDRGDILFNALDGTELLKNNGSI